MLGLHGARWAALVVLAAAIFISLGTGAVLVANHVNPCHPRNLARCGLRLEHALQGLDAVAARDSDADPDPGRKLPEQQAVVLCPALAETADCFFWFSQRCLPEREQHYYARLYVEGSALVSRMCQLPADSGEQEQPFLLSSAECLAAVRGRRAVCSQSFLAQLDGPERAFSVVDSLYDDEGHGTFRAPFCRALREYLQCALHLIRDACGFSAALHFQNLQLNLTQLIFGNKCDAALMPSLPLPLPAITHFGPVEDVQLLLLVLILIPVGILVVKRLFSSR